MEIANEESEADTYYLKVTAFAQSKGSHRSSKAVLDTGFDNPQGIIDGSQSSDRPTLDQACISSLKSEWETVVDDAKILSSRSLSPRVHQLILSSPTQSPPSLRHKQSLKNLEEIHSMELVIQSFSLPALPPPSSHLTKPTPPKLAIFDMDSTLIDQEIIDLLAELADPAVRDEVASMTAASMAGKTKLDFASSLRQRVKLLHGVRADAWEMLKEEKITFAEGARELCRALKKTGCRLGVLSGGFVEVAEWVAKELGLDEVNANHLTYAPADERFPHPHLTGQLDPEHIIVGPERKAELLQSIAASSEPPIPLSDSIAVGDGANDLGMMKVAGTGIGFKAKEAVQLEAPNRLNSESLVDILYLFGYTEEEIKDLIAV
ncbi:hypothetical protein MMC25_001956 [Agyrium rufum]|nr:hypothetical protein [Agyrium rufum]